MGQKGAYYIAENCKLYGRISLSSKIQNNWFSWIIHTNKCEVDSDLEGNLMRLKSYGSQSR